MPNFMLLSTGGDPSSMPKNDEERATFMKAWTDWYEQLGAALVDGGNPFAPDVKSIASDGSISDGPVGDRATGYLIIQAESLDDATAIAKDCPALQSGSDLTIYETVSMQ